MRLVNIKTNVEVRVGDTVTSFRGEQATVVSMHPPMHPASTGRVYVEMGGYVHGYFPSVFDCEWRPAVLAT